MQPIPWPRLRRLHRYRSAARRVQQHVWVVTGSPGDILFWETTKGDFYTYLVDGRACTLEGAAEAMQFGGMGGEGGAGRYGWACAAHPGEDEEEEDRE